MGEIIWNRSFDSDIHKLFLQIGMICASQAICIQSSTLDWFYIFNIEKGKYQLNKMFSVIDIWKTEKYIVQQCATFSPTFQNQNMRLLRAAG